VQSRCWLAARRCLPQQYLDGAQVASLCVDDGHAFAAAAGRRLSNGGAIEKTCEYLDQFLFERLPQNRPVKVTVPQGTAVAGGVTYRLLRSSEAHAA
jgi:hypothetical protein